MSSIPANKTITDVGINTLDTNKSANATLAMNALPERMSVILLLNGVESERSSYLDKYKLIQGKTLANWK